MRKTAFLTLEILFLSMITGCIHTVEIAPPEDRAVVVKCILMNDATPTVELYYSGAVGDTHFDPVENAQVMISTQAGSVYPFNYEKDGRYLGHFLPNPGQSYHLTVLVPGRDSISAMTTIPEKFEMEAAFFPPEEWLEDAERIKSTLQIPELSTPDFPIYDWEEYYRIYPWGLTGSYRKALEKMHTEGGSSIMDLMPGIVFSIVSSWPRVLYIVGIREEGGETTHVNHLATNHLLADKANLGEKFYHPVYDATADTSLRQRFERAVDTRYEGLPLHDDYLRIVSDGDYDNGLGKVYRIVDRSQVVPDDYLMDASTFFAVVGDFSYNYWNEDREYLHSSLYFCSVSEEYDLYLQDSHRQIASMKGDILTTLYSNATNNYTNIRGGFGIFGAMYVLRHDCDLERKPSEHTQMYDYFAEYPPYPAQLPEL